MKISIFHTVIVRRMENFSTSSQLFYLTDLVGTDVSAIVSNVISKVSREYVSFISTDYVTMSLFLSRTHPFIGGALSS